MPPVSLPVMPGPGPAKSAPIAKRRHDAESPQPPAQQRRYAIKILRPSASSPRPYAKATSLKARAANESGSRRPASRPRKTHSIE